MYFSEILVLEIALMERINNNDPHILVGLFALLKVIWQSHAMNIVSWNGWIQGGSKQFCIEQIFFQTGFNFWKITHMKYQADFYISYMTPRLGVSKKNNCPGVS